MIEVTAAVIIRNGEFLICQRPKGKSCELLWEFPGGKIEPGETGEQCIIRECQEELGVTLNVLKKLTDVTYDYPDRTVHLHFYITEIIAGELTRKEHNAFAWVTPDEINKYQFCPADAKMLSTAQFV
jgi:8-oxo-dGTP diphosphatase